MGFFKSKSKGRSTKSKSRQDSQTDSNESSTQSTTLSTPNRSRSPTLQSSTSPTAPTPPPTALTTHANTSSSNLSTTSTLYEQLPSQQPAPSSYEIFLFQAQIAARAEAQERGSRSWPHDPWRGGFGPPAGFVSPTPKAVLREKERTGERLMGEGGGLNPRREAGVKGWLGRNGLVRAGQ